MSLRVIIRRASNSVLPALLWAGLCLTATAAQKPAAAAPRAAHPPEGNSAGHPGTNQEHLLQWMQRRSNLTPDQQQKALEHEPGFRDLPPETQQRMRDHLAQLNNMPPERRQRLLERNEALARLSPPQRQQVRDAMKQFSSLSEDRRHQVARAFHDLRQLPEPQRQALINSESYRTQFSDQERGTLSGLLQVEPYLPIRPAPPAPHEP